jgi:hypothetical protein
MILQNFSLHGYVVFIGVGLILALIDCILTFVNSKLFDRYYELEILPWYKLAYQYIGGWFAFILTLIFNVLTFVVILFLPLKITWTIFVSGFWIYRLYHSAFRIYLWLRRK